MLMTLSGDVRRRDCADWAMFADQSLSTAASVDESKPWLALHTSECLFTEVADMLARGSREGYRAGREQLVKVLWELARGRGIVMQIGVLT